MKPPRRVRVLVTIRLSNDPKGDKASPTNQRRKIRDAITQQGWPMPPDEDWFVDRDKSATDEEVVRTRWLALLEEVRAEDRDQVEVIVIGFNQDRFIRQMADPKALADLIERKHGQLWSAVQGRIATGKGARGMLYVQTALSANESEATSSRTLLGIESAAMEGKSHGQVSYGWKRIKESSPSGKTISYEVLDDDAVKIIEEAVKRFLAGEHLAAICDDFNARGIAAPGAGKVTRRDPETKEALEWASDQWEPAKLGQILKRKRNIGIRVHKQFAGTTEEEIAEYPGLWPAILTAHGGDPADDLTLEAWQQVMDKLTDPERRTSQSNVAVHLCSGIATCGGKNKHDGSACTLEVTGQKERQTAKRSNRNTYRCKRSHTSKTMHRVDDVVRVAIVDVLLTLQLQGPKQTEDGAVSTARRRVSIANRKLADLEAEFDGPDNEWTPGQYRQRRAKAEANKAAAQAVLTSRSRQNIWDGLMDADDMGEAWTALPLIRKRAILRALVTITLLPTERRGKMAFDPETVVVTMREDIDH